MFLAIINNGDKLRTVPLHDLFQSTFPPKLLSALLSSAESNATVTGNQKQYVQSIGLCSDEFEFYISKYAVASEFKFI